MADKEFDARQTIESYLFPRNSVGQNRAQQALTGFLQTSDIDQRLVVAHEALMRVNQAPVFQGDGLKRATGLLNLIIGTDPRNNIFKAPGSELPLTAINQLQVAWSLEAIEEIGKTGFHPDLADPISRLKAGITSHFVTTSRLWFELQTRGFEGKDTNMRKINTMPVGSANPDDYPYLRSFADMTMGDLFSVPAPLTKQSFAQMSDYKQAFFNPLTNFENGGLGRETGSVAAKLLYEIFFRRGAERSDLERLSGEWQRRFVNTLILEMIADGQGEIQEKPMQKLTKNIISTVHGSPFEGISFLISGYIFDSLSGAGLSARDSRNLVQKWQEYGRSKHSNDPDYLYFKDPISVVLETVSAVPDYINPDPYLLPEEIMTPRIKDSIKANLSRVTKAQYQKVSELASVDNNKVFNKAVDDPQKHINASKKAWARIEEKGVHFLPGSDVIDVVDYDEDQDAFKFGLTSTSTKFQAQSGNLSVRVRFDFHTGFSVTGEVGSDGVLHFTNEAIEATDDIVPEGFKAYLSKTANRLIHDIVVQRWAGVTKPVVRERKEDEDGGDNSTEDNADQPGTIDVSQRIRNLPRNAWIRSSKQTRRATETVAALYKDAHPALLPYSNLYLDSIVEYLALLGLTSKTEQPQLLTSLLGRIESIVGEVKARRERVFRPSPDKLATIPPRMNLATVWDPAMNTQTDEGFIIQTWVKATEAEEGKTVIRRNQQPDSAFDWED